MVFLMGVTAMPKICKGLLDAGMRADMPAALLERGTTAHQRRVVSTLASLPEDAKAAGLKPPAIIVVGEVCALSEEFHWAEDRPLGTMKIAVTRPKDRSSALAEKLAELGAEVALMPAIETAPIEENTRLEEALDRIGEYSWIVFTSVAGIQTFYSAMKARRMDVRSLAGIRFAVIGTGTAKAVEKQGIFVDLMPEVYSGKALGELLARTVKRQERILIPRAKIGTEDVIRPLKEAGLSFDDIAVYDTREIKQTGIYDDSVDLVAFTSASTVRGFVKQNPDADFSGVKAICIGEQTAAAAKEWGMQVAVSEKATIDSMVEKIQELAR